MAATLLPGRPEPIHRNPSAATIRKSQTNCACVFSDNCKNVHYIMLHESAVFVIFVRKIFFMKILGIGSRINHPQYGKGVITNVSTSDYWVTFIDNGLETIPLDDTFETIEASENEVDTISLYDVEKTLKNLLQRWSDITPSAPIADKW